MKWTAAAFPGFALALCGCATQLPPYWAANPDWRSFRPALITIVEREDPSADCGSSAARSVLGCAVRAREDRVCTVFIRASLPRDAYACVLTHETRHCVGDDHAKFDKRPHYAVDCGTGELYSGPATSARGG